MMLIEIWSEADGVAEGAAPGHASVSIGRGKTSRDRSPTNPASAARLVLAGDPASLRKPLDTHQCSIPDVFAEVPVLGAVNQG